MKPDRVHLVTTNPGKRVDWHGLLTAHGISLAPVVEMPEVAETAPTVRGNARLKIEAVSDRPGWWLADDIGLEISALDGRPGVHLKRWATGLGGWSEARARCVTLAGSRARYLCAVALCGPPGIVVVDAAVDGRLTAPRGVGPGLEPCFLADGAPDVLSRLQEQVRVRFHHRALAFQALLAAVG